jgi:hypothetical protein
MKRILKIFLVGLIVCIVVILVVAVVGFFFYPPLGEVIKPYVKYGYVSMPLWISCTIPMPPDHGTLVFLQKGIHPSLAEYEYKLRFAKGSTKVERSLPSNSRGRILVNTYWYPASPRGGPWVRFQDQDGEYLVDITKQRVSRVLRYKGRVFTGELSGSREGTAIVESGGKIIVSVGHNDANEITELPIGSSQGTYIGRIEGKYYRLRFITPNESPEQRIRVME